MGEYYVLIDSELIKDGFVEFAKRDVKQRFSDFVKVKVEEKKNELPEEVLKIGANIFRYAFRKELQDFNEIKKNVSTFVKNANNIVVNVENITERIAEIANQFSGLDYVQLMQFAGMAANLVATTAGFAVVNKKLDTLSSKLDDIKEQIQTILKKDLADIEKSISEVHSNYKNMLDFKRKNKPYSEEQYHSLIVELYTLLEYLYKLFVDDAVFNRKPIIRNIYLLLPMFANALKDYDTKYYFANKNQIKGDYKWHIQHDEWVALIEKFRSKKFLEKLRIDTFLDDGFNVKETEAIVEMALLSSLNCSQVVSDQQFIIQHFDTLGQYISFEEGTIKEVVEECKEELTEEELELLNPLMKDAKEQLELAIAR